MAELPAAVELRRPWWLYVSTAFVLGGCLFFISAAAGSLAASWDLCAMVSGAILLPVPVFLGIEQYRASFRWNARAARHAWISLAIISGLIWFVGVTSATEIAVTNWNPDYWWPLAMLVGKASINALAAWSNFRWYRRLREAEAQRNLPATPKRFSLRELLLVMAGCSVVAAVVGYSVRTTPSQYAEHVTAGEPPLGLPKGATDVSYCQGVRGIIACEFTCDERAFVDWVEAGIGSIESNSSGSRVHPIASTYSITRYTFLMNPYTEDDSAEIDNGLYYDWSYEDRGVYAAYDRDTGRGYYYFHAH